MECKKSNEQDSWFWLHLLNTHGGYGIQGVYPAAMKLFLYWLILIESNQSPIDMKRG